MFGDKELPLLDVATADHVVLVTEDKSLVRVLLSQVKFSRWSDEKPSEKPAHVTRGKGD
jgi:hypothetical protein